MKTFVTKSFKETQQLGFDLAKKLRGRDVVCLHGDLGSGKTTFIQGFAKGLGITKKIISPTFIIMRQYVIPDLIRNPEILKQVQDDKRKGGNDKRNFFHVDLYRIESERDVEGLGLLEVMNDPDNIVVIEWPDKIEHLLPSKRIDIIFDYVDDDKRKIVFEQ